ncbi:MAG: hypothetical protein IIZ25_03810 [Thermoguttaceae bacterium]|nr:hypothetical protein [Thermoguttaceae bacterium]
MNSRITPANWPGRRVILPSPPTDLSGSTR